MAPEPVRPQATERTAPSRSYSAAVQHAAGDAVWAPAGQLVRVGGCSISGGLIYVGRELAATAGEGPDPALIDPGLGVDHKVPDYAGANMDYWPSYSTIAPACRAAYLQWLAHGRHAPHAYIGYVFLYFYGLERRLLVDAQQSAAARSEREMLLAEVRRLIGIYGTNGSFRGYATDLLAFVTADDAQRRYLSSPPTRWDGWQVPFELRLGLGQLAADGLPLPAAWALAWLRLHPEGWLRTAATRCPTEFDEVFTRRYKERYGAGLKVKPGSSAILAESYRPASRGIPVWHRPAGRGLPDVADLSAPLAQLREIAGEACNDLDAYSRYLGRHPDSAGTAAALALLPPGIERPADAATQALLAWADDSLGASDLVQVPAVDLLTRWSAASPESRPGKSGAALLARVLEGHGLGLEPDVRFGGAAPANQAPVVLFRRATERVITPSEQYAAAATMLQLGAAVAAADGRVAAAEQNFLERRVIELLSLAQDERRRLRAHLAYTLAASPTPATLRKRASLMPESQRQSTGELLVALAASDGSIAPAEMDLLARLFDLLGLERSDVHSQVRVLRNETLTPLRMEGTRAPTYSLPRQASADSPGVDGVVLDPELIKARLAESARAASYLAGIFTDDDAAADAVASPSGQGGAVIPESQIAGLDEVHTALLSRLAGQLSWTRDDFGRIAAELGLLPDGALETLNEAAFEAVGEPVCEGSDPIDINRSAIEEMLP
jgi:uncharacterized tellurite resistance protein B-like protein